LVESVHTGHVVVVDADGATVRLWGDPEALFYLRSAAKPFQTAVSQANGAALSPRQLAIASSSHGGEPVHTAIVAGMLAEVGLGPEHLLCPADWPMYPPAARRATRPQPLTNNCSGKHAAMLRACVASGWPLDYTRPDHPLQEQVYELTADVTGVDPSPVGVDGCGVPTLRTTTAGLGRAFARLATDPALAEVALAMHRYPYLTAGTAREESAIAVAANAAVKGGAKGCLGVAVLDQFGIAAKSDDGLNPPAAIAVIEAMAGLGLVTKAMDAALAEQRRPTVLGGGRPVGHYEPALA
jgi:L-asparaginase II